MTRHVAGRVTDVPPGSRLLVEIGRRSIVIFNLAGEFFALLNRCPHQGGALALGRTCGLVEATTPGAYRYSRAGEILRCPWHGWEFDIRTGRSCGQPDRVKAKAIPVDIAAGADLQEDPTELQVEIFPLSVDEDYLILDL